MKNYPKNKTRLFKGPPPSYMPRHTRDDPLRTQVTVVSFSQCRQRPCMFMHWVICKKCGSTTSSALNKKTIRLAILIYTYISTVSKICRTLHQKNLGRAPSGRLKCGRNLSTYCSLQPRGGPSYQNLPN